jgi:hypothetical protein
MNWLKLLQKIGIFICDMNDLFSFYRSKQLKPVWEFGANALIWRIFFTSSNKIVGETRDQEGRSTEYFCIDASTGEPLWKDVRFEEPWWIGVEAVHENWLILHGFVRPDMPQHLGIRVVDIDSGKLVWKNEDITFWFVQDEKLFAHKYLFEKRIGYEIDIRTGTIISEHDSDLDVLQEKRSKNLQQETDDQQGVIFPELYHESVADEKIRELIQKITDAKAIEDRTEYMIYRDVLVLSYYRQEQKKSESMLMDNVLSIYDLSSGKTVHNETIVESVKLPSPDTFFVKNDLLYFIKNRTILTAMRPWIR